MDGNCKTDRIPGYRFNGFQKWVLVQIRHKPFYYNITGSDTQIKTVCHGFEFEKISVISNLECCFVS